MDTLAFLNLILPTKGTRFLAKWISIADHPRGGVFIHRPYGEDDNSRMADDALRLSNKGDNIYFACSSYKEVIYKTNSKGKEYPAGRTQGNTLAAKAFWLDVDVGKPDPTKCYATKREAAQAVALLCKTVDLPMPMIVDSGAGLHCYWILTREIPSEQWTRVALMLRSIIASLDTGLMRGVDQSRTKDSASILRPIGCVNPKHNKAAKVMREAAPINVGLFATKLKEYIQDKGIKVQRLEPPSGAPSKNAALLGGMGHAPSSGKLIAEHCQFIGHFRDVLGAVLEPEWYAALGTLKHTIEGDALCHEWSVGHPDYEFSACQAKLDQWTYPPVSCDKTRASTTHCKGCTQTVKFPIHLGYTITEAAPDVVENPVDPALDPAANDASVVIPHRPAGYRWTGQMLVREIPNKDGVVEDYAFSDTLFYPISRVRGEDDTWNLRIRMNVSGHRWREFDLPTMLVPDPKGLARHLAKYEIIIFGINHAMNYIKDYTLSLLRLDKQTTTYGRFGWDDQRNFVVGTTAFTPTGETTEVLVTDNIHNVERAQCCTPSGDLATWVDLLDTAYNRPNAEQYQFVIAAAFASPLISLAKFENYSGIPVVLSGEGGIGKSSVCKAAATIFATPNMLLVNASKTGGITFQGLMNMAALYNGVPLIFDELTDRDAGEFIPTMYSLSNGMGRIRVTAAGKFAVSNKPFNGMYFGTANANVTDKIYDAEKKDVSDAVSARCFEIGGLTEESVIETFKGTNMVELLDKLFVHHGLAAQVYLPYVAQHRDQIVELIAKTKSKLGSDSESSSRERYYIDTIAFAFVGATIASRLGLIRWDVKAMTMWAIGHLKNLRRIFAERSALADDNVSMFLSWLYPSTVITRHFPLGKPKADDFETPGENLRGKPLARMATKDKRFIVRIDALKIWCDEYRQSVEAVKRQLIQSGYVIRERREHIGKGTHIVTGQSRCFDLDYDRVIGHVGAVGAGGNVVAIKSPGTEPDADPIAEAGAENLSC